MSGHELIDVFDELGRHAGVRDRATVHAEGWWHQAFLLLIVARRTAGPVVILQRRATTKVAFPDLLDLSATGHLAAGERPVDGVRELREELGVDLAPDALHPLGVRRIVDETPEGLNREFCHVFLVLDDRPLGAYRPDPAEVSAVVELDTSAGRDLFAGVVDSVVATEQPRAGAVTSVEVRREHFVPEGTLGDVAPGSGYGYWLTLLTMAEHLSDGDSRLAI
jgi:isopentenyldiphosphate isomerase